MLDGVRMVWEGLLKESLEVVYWQSRLVLTTARGSHDTPHAGAICLLVFVIVIVVGHDLTH
jgi:hypothetical protein